MTCQDIQCPSKWCEPGLKLCVAPKVDAPCLPYSFNRWHEVMWYSVFPRIVRVVFCRLSDNVGIEEFQSPGDRDRHRGDKHCSGYRCLALLLNAQPPSHNTQELVSRAASNLLTGFWMAALTSTPLAIRICRYHVLTFEALCPFIRYLLLLDIHRCEKRKCPPGVLSYATALGDQTG